MLSDDPTAGLTGVLHGTGGRIASACEGLADVTERTHSRMLATLAHYAGGDEWYHPVADVIDLFVRFKAAHAIAAAGDAYLLDLDLSTIHDEHVRAVDSVRGELHPAGADRLVRLATAMSPPVPVPANTCAVTPPAGRGASRCRRRSGRPSSPRSRRAATDHAGGGPADHPRLGRQALWIARGDGSAGLQHLLRPQRVLAFLDQGVAPADIPGLALRAVAEGPPIGRVRPKDPPHDEELRRQGKEPGFVYSVDIGGGAEEHRRREGGERLRCLRLSVTRSGNRCEERPRDRAVRLWSDWCLDPFYIDEGDGVSS